MAEGTKIKIAFCTDGIFPHSIGGIQRHSTLLLRELSNYQNLEIHVLHPHDFEVFQDVNLIEHFIKPIQISRNYLLETYKYSQRISEELDRIKFAICLDIHCHFPLRYLLLRAVIVT